jgi:hypothetical protein
MKQLATRPLEMFTVAYAEMFKNVSPETNTLTPGHPSALSCGLLVAI